MKLVSKMTAAVFSVALLAGGLAMSNTMAPSAVAQIGNAKKIVDDAKSKGLVGETIDGYLELVEANVSADIQAAVNEINIRRKSVYTQLAREKNTSPDNVAGVSGEKLTAKAAPGEKVKLSDGRWHIVR